MDYISVPMDIEWSRQVGNFSRAAVEESYLITHSPPPASPTAAVAQVIQTQLPELHWDNLEQVFPHWSGLIPEAARF